jgi:hypothetical protein
LPKVAHSLPNCLGPDHAGEPITSGRVADFSCAFQQWATRRLNMISKRLMIAAATLAGTTLAATTAGFAQDYYDYAPGAGLYDYGGPSSYGPAIPDVDRGGPGPRVQAGSGMGIGAVR